MQATDLQFKSNALQKQFLELSEKIDKFNRVEDQLNELNTMVSDLAKKTTWYRWDLKFYVLADYTTLIINEKKSSFSNLIRMQH